jgi:hypothetical protein
LAQGHATIFDGGKTLKMKQWMKSHCIHFVLWEFMDELF